VKDTRQKPALWSNCLLGIAQILVWGGSFFLIAVLADPVVKDTGWSRQWVYGSLSLGIFISALLAPMAGRLIARHGGRGLLPCGGVVIAVGLLVLACAPSLPVFMLAWVIIGSGMACGLYDALYASLGRQYGDNARGSITQITLISGFCTTITWPVIAYLIEHLGWREACGVYAALLAAVIWPMYAISIPKDNISAADPIHKLVAQGTSPMPAGRIFLLITASFTLASVIMTVISVQLITLLQDQGLSLTAAIGIGALIGPSQVGARTLDVVARKVHPIWSTLLSAGLVFVGLMLITINPALAVAGIILYGAGSGIRSIVRGTLPLAIFGQQAYAEVLGRIARPTLMAQAVTPLAAGYLIDTQGSSATLIAMCSLAFINIMLAIMMLPFRRKPTAPF